MKNTIRKAVLPVAGLGTRFLPATKAVPKEMLTLVDRPILQHVVDEVRAAGIEHFIFVTGRNKAVIEDHFDRHPELEQTLAEKGKTDALAALEAILPAAGTVSFTRQQQPLGLGHAILCARELVGDEPFAVLLPDVVTHCPADSCLKQLMTAYDTTGGNVLAIENVAPQLVSNYGIVGLADCNGILGRVASMVEKPHPAAAPSNKMIMGRYLLQPEIFAHLERQTRGASGEIQLTDALVALMQQQPFHALEYRGRSYDCGQKLGFILANVALGLTTPQLGAELRGELVDLLAASPAYRRP